MVVPVITPSQLSVVVGDTAVPVHCPVTSANIGVAGFVVSFTVTLNVQLSVFPTSSSAVIVITVFPVITVPAVGLCVNVIAPGAEQLSVALAPEG